MINISLILFFNDHYGQQMTFLHKLYSGKASQNSRSFEDYDEIKTQKFTISLLIKKWLFRVIFVSILFLYFYYLILFTLQDMEIFRGNDS